MNELTTDLFDFPQPEPGEISAQISLWATTYYVHEVVDEGDGEPLLDVDGNELGPRINPYDWCLGAIEGTMAVTDDNCVKTIYNYAGESGMQVDCSKYFPNFGDSGDIRWKKSSTKFGEGRDWRILVPMRSIAVDARVLKLDSVLYIPAARGRWIKSGEDRILPHDGYFYAADTGGKIRHPQIDIFTGRPFSPFSKFAKNSSDFKFDAMLIENREIADKLAKLHGK